MCEVVERLKKIIVQTNITDKNKTNQISKITKKTLDNQTNQISMEDIVLESNNNLLHGELSQIIQNFFLMNTKEIIISFDNTKMVDEIVKLIFNKKNKGIKAVTINRHIVDHLDNQNITTYGIYYWLSNTNIHNDINSIFLLGYFNHFGIGSNENKGKAFELFINASKQNHNLAHYYVGECYRYGHGTTKNEKFAFEYYEKTANKDFAVGQLEIGDFYIDGIGIEKDLKKAVYWYEKAVNLGNVVAMHKLGLCYKNGTGVDVDNIKAFELFKKSAEEEHPDGIAMLGYCYNTGIGTNVDKQKVLELYEVAANLENKFYI